MIYRFADCALDTKKHELRRAGEKIELDRKGFKILLYLLQNRDRLVSREELLDACWSRKYVNEAALTNNISRIRKAIGQLADQPTPIIQTVRGKGFRWLAEVSEQTTIEAEQQAPDVLAATAVWHRSSSDSNAEIAEQRETSDTTPWKLAESRWISVLCCSLVNDSKDWEERHQHMQSFYRIAAEVIAPFDAYLAQHYHDRLLIYFGYPHAHEDDVLRAIHSAVQLLAALKRQNLNAVIGIHTGAAIIETLSSGSQQLPIVVGELPAIAEALARSAPVDKIIVSAATAQLADAEFEWQALPVQSLNDQPEPLHSYQLAQGVPSTSLPSSVPRRSLTPFIERVAEQTLLQERWSQARLGRGQTILLSGEAGIGKSRLVQTLRQQIERESNRYLEGQSSPYQQNTPLAPVVMLLQQWLQWQAEDEPELKLQALETLLESHRLPLEQNIPLLADVLSLELPKRYPALTLEPRQWQRQRLELLLTLLLQYASKAPLLLVIEDLHWADPSTLEWLDHLITQVPTTAILLLLTARPDFTSSWHAMTSRAMTSMVLERFMPTQIERMLVSITGGKPLPKALQQQIIEKTDGVPLFIEELMQSLLESGQLRETEHSFELTDSLNILSVPTTLQGLLMARLDRLGETKELVYWGAVIGREFSYRLLTDLTSWDEALLARHLQQLMNSGLVFQHGIGQQTRYQFKHALVQEVAYQTMLKRQRRVMHQRVAEVLEKQQAAGEEVASERLAQHHTEAGNAEQAIFYWQQAGEKAITRSAVLEAKAHINAGLALFKQLPDRQEYQQQELTLQVMLGIIKHRLQESDADIEITHQRILQLYHRLGEALQQVSVLWRLSRYCAMKLSLGIAREAAERILRLLQKQPEEINYRVLGHEACGTVLYFMSEFGPARIHFEQALKHYESGRHHLFINQYSVFYDPGVTCLSRLALVLANLGYAEQAVQRIEEALLLANRLSHPFSRVYALFYATLLYVQLGQKEMAMSYACKLSKLAKQENDAILTTTGQIVQNTAQALQGKEIAENIKQIQQCISLQSQSGVFLPFWLYLLASVCRYGGQFELGRTAVDQALAHLDQLGITIKRYELLILKGQLYLRCSSEELAESPEQTAEQYFQQAYQETEKQQAKLLQLRATTNLARLWQSQGRRKKAYQWLFPVYDWFTEGFDTVDLKEAKALLDELA